MLVLSTIITYMEKLVRGVLFDLDGTLVDTIPDIATAINSALAEENLAPLEVGQVQAVVGRGLRNALKGALAFRGREVSDGRLDELLEKLMETYEAHPADHSVPYDGIEDFLIRLADDGIAIGVLSNKADSLIQVIVRQLFPEVPFSMIEGMRSDTPRKPDPQGIHGFSRKTGVPVSRILYVGDSEVDWQTACNVPEVQVAIVTWGFRSKESLVASGVSAPLDTIGELEEKVWR